MEYWIRIQPGKEKAFQEFIKALESLGVVKSFEKAPEPEHASQPEEHQGSSSKELASQYWDLVD